METHGVSPKKTKPYGVSPTVLTLEKYATDNFTFPDKQKQALESVKKLNEAGFTQMCDTRGDGNCFIYSCIGYLQKTCIGNNFYKALERYTYTSDLKTLEEKSQKFIEDGEMMQRVATKIREKMKEIWYDYYMTDISQSISDSAIDGIGRRMVMRLLGIGEVVNYTLIPEKDKPIFRMNVLDDKDETAAKKHDIPQSDYDLREDIPIKYVAYTISTGDYNHYGVLF